MILIGLTGWGEHPNLYGDIAKPQRLQAYAGYFPTVELDSSFYAIQPLKNGEKWVRETPDSFQFIIKAYQGMTGHQREALPFETRSEMFALFKASIQPYIEANKLAMVLFQFPPWFNCTKENVMYLRYCRQQMENIPCALEFRHVSWFEHKFKEKTIQFMKEENWIHAICDEPQAGAGSVPTVLIPTNDKVLIRFHGRNIYGWNNHNQPDWRAVRYLYHYNKKELNEWAENIKILQQQCKNIYILFNNNSSGDAAENAVDLQEILQIHYDDLAPRQLDLF